MFKSRYIKTPNQNHGSFFADLSAGFYVFLLALPLSLGIAEASGFPAVMGLITAAVGGMITSWFTGSKLSIKGPAAGLIVIVLGAVNDLGAHDPINGWKWALLAVFVGGLVQVVMGLLKFGKYVNLIPPSAIQGMLAAIGVVILSKQLYILLGIPAVNDQGVVISKPLALISNLWYGLHHVNTNVALIGAWSLVLVWAWTKVQHPVLKSIPSPLVVLLTVIPFALYLELPQKYLLNFNIQAKEVFDFRMIIAPPVSWFLFLKYVGLFAIIGGLESLLTVNALQNMKPEDVPNKDKDLIAIGVGNMISSLMGGLPMISEVARSTANIDNGARTHLSNFLHGTFIFLFILSSSWFNQLIPLSALAAMLVLVGIRLASPKVLVELKKIGTEQIWGFSITLIGSLYFDLLWGLALGSLAKYLAHRILYGNNQVEVD